MYASDSEHSNMDPSPFTLVKQFDIYDYTENTNTSEDSLCNYYFIKALETYNSKEYYSAIHQFKKSLAYDPTHFESFIDLGGCYYRLQLLDEAIIVFGKTIKLRPKSFAPYLNKALSEMYMQRYDDTIATIDLALGELEDPPEKLYKIRTYALYQSGRMSNIITDIKSKDGFEPKKKYSANQIIKTPVPPSQPNSRPLSSKPRNKTLLDLYPNSKKSFINILEIDTRSMSTTKPRMPFNDTPPVSKNKKFRHYKKTDSKYNSKSSTARATSVAKEDTQKAQTTRRKFITVEPKDVTKTGLVQIDTLHRFQNNLQSKENSEKFHQTLESLKKYVEKDLERAEELKEDNKENDYEFISEFEIKTLTEEFLKPEISIEKIDKIAKKLSFLQKFPFIMRESLYYCSKIVKFSPGDVIFNEGDSGDTMYIIIKGSIVVNKRMSDLRNYPVIITSLYDGRQFGDVSVLSALSDQDIRKGTCIATEISTMFCIPKNEYKRLLFKFLRPEIEEKANFLAQISLFKYTELSNLYTLASNIQFTSYSLGDPILKKGQMPAGLYIIRKGHVEVVTEGYIQKQKKPLIYGNAKIREKSPKPFYTGNVSPESPKTKPSDPDNVSRTVIKPKPCAEELLKDRILNFILHPNEYFGGRALIDGEVIGNNLIKATNSKFSFVAKSPIVEVVIVTKELAHFLDAETEHRIKSFLAKSFHIDSPDNVDPHEMDQLFKKWQRYKLDFIEDIRRSKYLERNKLDFPYIR
jgi:CRP-like cAMP-binding protein/tetratricopeptide (TPR) repeat protein